MFIGIYVLIFCHGEMEFLFFFFKQKTAYEMRISDWSSDVCSSDLLIEDVEGALWTRALLEERRTRTHPGLRRVVVGVDPPAGVGGDACGIVVAGLAEDGRAHVLEDASVHGLHPEGWARAVAAAAGRWQADKVVAEVNNGGAMVTSVLQVGRAHV